MPGGMDGVLAVSPGSQMLEATPVQINVQVVFLVSLGFKSFRPRSSRSPSPNHCLLRSALTSHTNWSIQAIKTCADTQAICCPSGAALSIRQQRSSSGVARFPNERVTSKLRFNGEAREKAQRRSFAAGGGLGVRHAPDVGVQRARHHAVGGLAYLFQQRRAAGARRAERSGSSNSREGAACHPPSVAVRYSTCQVPTASGEAHNTRCRFVHARCMRCACSYASIPCTCSCPSMRCACSCPSMLFACKTAPPGRCMRSACTACTSYCRMLHAPLALRPACHALWPTAMASSSHGETLHAPRAVSAAACMQHKFDPFACRTLCITAVGSSNPPCTEQHSSCFVQAVTAPWQWQCITSAGCRCECCRCSCGGGNGNGSGSCCPSPLTSDAFGSGKKAV